MHPNLPHNRSPREFGPGVGWHFANATQHNAKLPGIQILKPVGGHSPIYLGLGVYAQDVCLPSPQLRHHHGSTRAMFHGMRSALSAQQRFIRSLPVRGVMMKRGQTHILSIYTEAKINWKMAPNWFSISLPNCLAPALGGSLKMLHNARAKLPGRPSVMPVGGHFPIYLVLCVYGHGPCLHSLPLMHHHGSTYAMFHGMC
jgi:hypothetical protein